MSYVVVDIECTCDEPSFPGPQETIEIGAVCVDYDSSIGPMFGGFIRPVINPVLTPFCTKLTTITQDNVDASETFPAAFRAFTKWLKLRQPAIMVSWSRFDWRQLKKESDQHGLEWPFLRHINLPAVTKRVLGTGNNRRAMKKCGIAWEGTRHRGIDDATNYAKIAAYLIRLKQFE